MTDITYVPTAQEWLYLTDIKDLFTCEVVGHAMDARMRTDFVSRALRKALTTKRSGRRLFITPIVAPEVDSSGRCNIFVVGLSE